MGLNKPTSHSPKKYADEEFPAIRHRQSAGAAVLSGGRHPSERRPYHAGFVLVHTSGSVGGAGRR